MALQLDDSGASGDAFTITGQQDGLRLLAGNQALRIRFLTVRSHAYAVEFTFAITHAQWVNGDSQQLAGQKTAQVNALAAYEHAVQVSTAQDVDGNGNIVNELIVSVGTPDGAQTADVTLRMDSLGLRSAQAALDAAYATLAKAGGF